MIIKVSKNWKDLVDSGSGHKILSRREFLARGMATSAMAVALPHIFAKGFVKEAWGAGTVPSGGIFTSFSNGGCTQGARILSDIQAAAVAASKTMAANYGVLGTDMVNLGPNFNVSASSPFGATLLQGPDGYTGGPAAWKANVLSKCAAGGHFGPFNADDGAGQNSGLWGIVSPFQTSTAGKDIVINNSVTVASFAAGAPLDSIKGKGNNNTAPFSSLGVTSASLASVFSLTPATAGLATSATIASAATASTQIASAFSSLFNNATGVGATMLANAQSAMNKNAPLASPTYGASLFTPAQIPALTATGGLTAAGIASFSPQEQALLASYYQSSIRGVGGVITHWGGRDYHGQDVQQSIAPSDIEEARALVMALAASAAAGTNAVFMHFSNGQAIASGVQSVTATIGTNTAAVVNGPVAQGDAGGSYNACTAVFYSPTAAPAGTKFSGTINATTGNATAASGISVPLAVGGMYLSALAFTNGGTPPAAAVAQIGSAASSFMVIS